MNRPVIILFGATAAALGWLLGKRDHDRAPTPLEPLVPTSDPPTRLPGSDPMVRTPPNPDPSMIRTPPNIDPGMVRQPSWPEPPPKPPRQEL